MSGDCTNNPSTEGLRILVVDDDPDNRRMLTRRLERKGYETGIACDGREALDILERERFDLVLMDYMMPEMNGMEALRAIRQTWTPGALPVIMVTAKTDGNSIVEALGVGANDYLAKPIEMPVALARIASQIDRLIAERKLAAMNGALEQRVAERTKSLEHEIARRADVEEAMRETERQLRKAITAKTQFIANMSHELRTPLNAIIGFADLMLNQIGGKMEPPQFHGYVNNIYDSGRHLLEIINDILEIVSLENGKMELAESVVPLADIIDASRRMLSCQLEEAGLSLELDVARDSAQVRCDPRLMRQAVMNLICNAIKHTPSEGLITVSVRSLEGGACAIVVRDTGNGIPRDKIPEMLKPFEQLDTSYTRSHGGLGLGLPLVVGIMECHGGALEIESDLGQGVEARLVLPAERIIGSNIAA